MRGREAPLELNNSGVNSEFSPTESSLHSSFALMPLQHKYFTSKFGGFICKSCLSRLLAGRQPSTYRSFSNRSTLGTKPDGSASPRMDREVHFYDQTPDGNRVERFVDKEYDEKADAELLDEDLKQTIEENKPTIRKLYKSSIPDEYHLSGGLGNFEKAGERIKAFIERVKSFGHLESLPPEKLRKLEEDILNQITDNQDEPTESEPLKETTEENAQKSEDFNEVDPNEFDFSDLQKYLPSEPMDLPSKAGNKDDKVPNNRTSRRFPVSDFPKPYQENINLLQDCIEACFEYDQTQKIRGKAVKVTKDMLRSHLARSYMFARKGLLAASESVPLTLWEDLWQILVVESKENLNRLTYTRRIGEDMDELGIYMTSSQHLAYVEALFLDGARKSAIVKWQGRKPRRNDPIWEEYWEIGLRMLAQFGRFDQALKIAEFYFEGMKDRSRYRALMPLIKACLVSKKDLWMQRAWALYIRLRCNLDNEMVMKDYDVLISWFMDAEKPDLALAIFRDMMLSGNKTKNIHDSTAIHKISGIVADFEGVKIDQSELEWENTREISVLPVKFRNKFFFGSWIKKLIGDNELSSAKKVLDLMQDHGITPSPMHMNGLIGAWFRRGSEDDFALADTMAWRMINRRLEYMDIRNYQHSLEKPLRPNLNGTSIGDKSALIFPMATIETYCLLVQQYRQRQKKDMLPPLFTSFVKSRIPPNCRYMNQIILTDTRNHKTSLAFDTYQSITARGVKPDHETFILLWNLMKRSVDPSVGRKGNWQSPIIGTCRNLFAEMMKWKVSLSERYKFPRELYDLIILSFSLKQDQVATAVALRALQQEFGMYPDENCIRTIVLQLARYGLRNKVGMKPRRLNISSSVTKDRIGNVMEFFEKIKTGRAEYLLQKGIDPDQLSIDARKEESIVISVEVLRHVTTARIFGEKRNDFNCSIAAKQAAEQMGVPNCQIWEEGSPTAIMMKP
ncbi:putative pentatricopeptide repeat protein [Golovinomyces cichoracearum]|uniref:Putative pentatricopeptide repeat protein n=1 Tax=Golovinomyces cichoracearum TaxID=62708 RepID=A0A420IED1_9PEZI|nr:putative pentatricopeptide repeat protein [Golovinomyces cichoracearum]